MMMKRFRWMLLTHAVLGLISPVHAEQPTFLAKSGYASMYLWRGLDLGDDLVETSLDVSGEWSGFGISAGAWHGSMQNAPAGNDAELDLYGEISRDFGPLTGSVGYIFYHFFQVEPTIDAQEIYLAASRDFGLFHAEFTWYWDIETDNDGYCDLALTRSFELCDRLSMGVDTRVGWLAEHQTETAWSAKASLDWSFREPATLSAYLLASVALSDDASTVFANTGNELVSGMLLSFGF